MEVREGYKEKGGEREDETEIEGRRMIYNLTERGGLEEEEKD